MDKGLLIRARKKVNVEQCHHLLLRVLFKAFYIILNSNQFHLSIVFFKCAGTRVEKKTWSLITAMALQAKHKSCQPSHSYFPSKFPRFVQCKFMQCFLHSLMVFIYSSGCYLTWVFSKCVCVLYASFGIVNLDLFLLLSFVGNVIRQQSHEIFFESSIFFYIHVKLFPYSHKLTLKHHIYTYNGSNWNIHLPPSAAYQL